MHEPSVVLPVEPYERSVAGARHEVVALCVVAVPPAALDALRAGEQLEIHLREAPRRFEQPQWPRPRLREFARVPFTRLDASPGEFRAVIGLGGEAMRHPGA